MQELWRAAAAAAAGERGRERGGSAHRRLRHKRYKQAAPNALHAPPRASRRAAPYLQSEYGDDFGREAPVRLLEKLLLGKKRFPEEEIVVVSQVRRD